MSTSANRGRRVEEQLEVMRLLWTQGAGDLRGTVAPRARRRDQAVARPATDSRSGWAATARWSSAARPVSPTAGSRCRAFAQVLPAGRRWTVVHGLVRDAGRDPAAFGIEGRSGPGPRSPWRSVRR